MRSFVSRRGRRPYSVRGSLDLIRAQRAPGKIRSKSVDFLVKTNNCGGTKSNILSPESSESFSLCEEIIVRKAAEKLCEEADFGFV